MVYDSNFIDTVCSIGTFHIPYYDINTNQMDTAIYSLMMDTSIGSMKAMKKNL